MLIVSKLIVNKLKSDAEFLVKYSMLSLVKPFQQLTDKRKLRGRLRQRLCIKNEVEHDDSVEVETLNENPTVR